MFHEADFVDVITSTKNKQNTNFKMQYAPVKWDFQGARKYLPFSECPN